MVLHLKKQQTESKEKDKKIAKLDKLREEVRKYIAERNSLEPLLKELTIRREEAIQKRNEEMEREENKRRKRRKSE